MPKALPEARVYVHVARSPAQVLDYLEGSLIPSLNLVSPLVDREAMTAEGTTFPGATVGAGGDGRAVVNLGGGTMNAWIVSFTCHPVGEGANVEISVVQFMGGFLAKLTAKGALGRYAEGVAERIRSDLA